MPGRNRSIGGRTTDLGGPNLGNDYSRDITRESQIDDSSGIVVSKKHQDKKSKSKEDQKKDHKQSSGRMSKEK